MKKLLSWTALILLFLLSGGALVPTAAADPEKTLLPPSGFSPGWILEGPLKNYSPDDLFEYINGEAELYLQHGFQNLVSGFYLNEPNEKQGLSADVYRMASPLEAFGIYARYRGMGVRIVAVGMEGFVSAAQMMFCQGRYFVQLNASGTASLPAGVFLALARSISASLPEPPAPLRELEWVKIEGFIPGSEKYIPTGVLGYPFFNKGLMAQVLHEDRPVRVFLLLGDSAAEAQRAVLDYEKLLRDKGIAPKKTKVAAGEVLCTRDSLYSGLCLQARDRLVLGVADLKELDGGLPLVQQLEKRIP
ncbi:MAG: hypothetical protein MUF69_06935 [Desulfobacterota bacterium]|jgi:hypothetical protein|nr:hypothetical protein [Thermodesulfobacteriota bacterium]